MDKTVSLTQITKENSNMLKGFAILIVLLSHTQYFPWGGGGVGLFILLSGYGINQSVKGSGLGHYWAKRIKTVYIPYLAIACLNLLAFGAKRKIILTCTLLGLDFSWNRDSTMWYISYIFYWYLSYYLLSYTSSFIKNSKTKFVVKYIVLIAAALLSIKLYHLGVWHDWSSAEAYLLMFPLGVLFSDLSNIKVSRHSHAVFWSLVLFACTAYLFSYYPQAYYGAWLPLALQLIAIVNLVEMSGKIGSAINWLGKYSFSIYLIEGITVFYHRNDWFAVLENQLLIDIAAIAFTLALAWVYWEAVYEKVLKTIPLEKYIKI